MSKTIEQDRADLAAGPPRAAPGWWSLATLFFAACSGSIDYGDGSEFEPGAAPPGPASTAPANPQTGTDTTGVVEDAPATTAPDALPEDGPGLYQALCATCHGEQGSGTTLAPEVQHPPPEYFRWVVRNGLEGAYDSAMLAFPVDGLTDAQLDSILDYLSQLPEATSDEGLYLDYCGNCHGSDARGGVANKNIAGKREFLEVLRQGKGGTNFAARTRYMPSWGTGELGDAVVTQLEAYVGALPE